MEAVKNKKQDRTGEKFHDWTVIGREEGSNKWIMRCKCGQTKTVLASRMHVSKSCKSCSKNKNGKSEEKFKDKFTERQKWMNPKQPKFDTEKYYRISDDRFHQPIVGKLINEYRYTATFEIVNYHESDKALLRELNFRIAVIKRVVDEMEG